MDAVITYLRRLGWSGDPPAPDEASLVRLHVLHQQAVPFENLDILAGRPLSLDREDLFRKVVEEERGGFCYELNGLFSWLLRSLGHEVQLRSARVVRPDTGEVGPPRDHLCLRVTCGRPWLCDVGFGRSFLAPLPWPAPEPIPRAEGVFQVVEEGEETVVRRSDGTGPLRDLYRIAPEVLELLDFEEMCLHHQTSADSHFPKGPVVSRVLSDGRVTLRGRKATVERQGQRIERELASEEEVRAFLEREVGLPPR